MKVTRQRTILIPLVTLGLASALHAQDWSKVRIHTAPVADNVYVLTGGGGNIALSVGADGALLVDAGYEQLGEKIMAAVGAACQTPIRLVINTHWHFDHVGGNQKLSEAGAIIVAHQNVRKLMSEERSIAAIDRRVPPSPDAALPVLTFEQSLTFHWNGDEVRVIHVEDAHTNGDSMVYFREANVLHVGDTWFNGMYPFIDVNAEGSLDGVVAGLDRALELAGEKTKVIPGHGQLSDASGLREYRDMLVTVRDRVRVLVTQGKSREEVIASQPTKEFDDRWGRSWMTPDTWVGLVYDGMTRK